MKRKVLSLSLVVVIVMQFFVGITIVSAFDGGTGRAGDPYKISTASQLSNIRSYLGSHFILMNDITVGSWSPVGTSTTSSQFTGTFDGNGKTITVSYISGSNYTGFFGYTNGATIKNLKLKGATSSSYVSGGDYTGAFVGRANGSLTLTNCETDLKVSGGNYTGGLVGTGYDAKITSCTFTGSSVNGRQYVGGIIGKGNENGSQIGTHIYKCASTATVTAVTTQVGGIVGQLTGTVKESYSTGNITGQSSAGGIAGDFYYPSGVTVSSTVENCYSTGNISTTSSTSSKVGGIVGDATPSTVGKSSHSIKNSYSTGSVSGSYYFVGGIVGRNGSSSSYSYVTGSVAINERIWQKNSNQAYVGRIGGSESGYSSNYAIDGLPIYYANGKTLPISGESRNGTSKSLSTLQTASFYQGIGWSISASEFDTTTWVIRSGQFPELRWSTKPPVGVTIGNAPANGKILVDDVMVLTANLINPSDRIASWTSSHPQYASVTMDSSDNKKATLKGLLYSGNNKVTVTVTTTMGATATIEFVVDNQPVPTLREASIGLLVGESTRVVGLMGLTATTLNRAEPSAITWSSGNPAVAEVNPSTGKVTAISNGITTITGRDANGKEATINVCVHDRDPILPESITINQGDSLKMVANQYQFLTATILPANADNKTIKWKTDNYNIVSIDTNTGKIFAMGAGVATITAETFNGLSVDILIEVTQPVESIAIEEPDTKVIEVGDELQLSVEVRPEGAIANSITWECEPRNIVSVDGTGKVTALAKGVVNITAIVDGMRSNPIVIQVGQMQDFELARWTAGTFSTVQADGTIIARAGLAKDTAKISTIGLNNLGISGIMFTASGWNNSTEETPKAWLATIPAAGYSNFTVTFEQRSNDASPNTFKLQYSTDGTNWIDVSSYTVRQTGQDALVFSTFTESIHTETVTGNLYLRWRNASNSNAIDGILGSGALSFFRNIVVTAHQ